MPESIWYISLATQPRLHAKRLARYGIDTDKNEGKGPYKMDKYVRRFVIIASVLLVIAVPIGTFVGIVLLRESWMLKNDIVIEIKEKKSN